MKFSQQFGVEGTPEDIWAFFKDVPTVAQCLPGAELTEDRGSGSYAGTVSVKLGPLNLVFEGTAHVVEDDEALTGTVTGQGVDRRGGSRGRVRVDYRVAPAERGSQVALETDLTLAGPAAQFGRTGLVSEMAARIVGEFVSCVEAKLAVPPEEAATISAEPVGGVRLVLASVWASLLRTLRRLFGRG